MKKKRIGRAYSRDRDSVILYYNIIIIIVRLALPAVGAHNNNIPAMSTTI